MARIVFVALFIVGLTGCSGESDKVERYETELKPQTHIEITTDDPVETINLSPLKKSQKLARCVIGPDRYEGACVFQTLGDGSFAVSKRDQSPIYDEVSLITVSIVAKNKAEVFGLTTFGNNSRWGGAVRSKEDRACWEGSNFQVCAY